MVSRLNDDKSQELTTVRIALAGNPNCGKTSLFNALTGARQNVGNYPGVTVEKRSGIFKRGNREFLLTDLPGTYSLSSYSPEERIAQDEILGGQHDVVVVIADSTTLNRGLVLLAQVMLTGAKIVLCLNMADEAEKAGQKIDVRLMSELLGLPVVETIGCRGEGTEGLIDALETVLSSPPAVRPKLVLGERLDSALNSLKTLLDGNTRFSSNKGWIALRLIAGDQSFIQSCEKDGKADVVVEALRQRESIERETGQDVATYIAGQFFGFVDGLLGETLVRRSRDNARKTSNKIDTVLVSRLFGLPLFALIMFAIFWTTFNLGEIPMGWIESGFSALSRSISQSWPDNYLPDLHSLVTDGIIAGVGGVLVFLPNIILLFLGLSLLEDTGYMARAAFLMDRVMHSFGLHGKSFLPMLTGFGCSIPGIMATRTLENERDRLATMMVLPLMSCGARLPIWMLLIPAFFPLAWRAPVLWSIYSFGIVLALLLALLLKRTLFRSREAPFVMELPPYRFPTLKSLYLKVWERSWLYLRKAGTVILAISIIMWFITAYPNQKSEIPSGVDRQSVSESNPNGQTTSRHDASERLRHSYAGKLGSFLEPVFKPLGFDWKIVTGAIGAFAAKEVFVSQMGIVYSLSGEDGDQDSLRSAIGRDYSPLVGLSLILFLLIGFPCMATFAVIKRESGSVWWAVLQFAGLTSLAYIVSLIVYQTFKWLQ